MGGPGSGPTRSPADPRPLADDRDLWLQQPKETGQAFEAFKLYRDQSQGARSAREVARLLGKSPTLISRWGGAWSWRKRSRAWDSHVDREALEAEIEAVRDARKRHVNIAKLMQGVGGKALEALFRKIEKEPKAALELSPTEARLLAETGIKTERLLLGEPGELTKVEVEGQGEGAYEAVLAKIARALGVEPEDV